MQPKYVLGCETSCDETSLALLEIREGYKVNVLFHKTASQVAVHAPFGGVVPNLAKREHQKNLPILWDLLDAQIKEMDISPDYMCVTVGPGLEPALWQGISFFSDIHKKRYPDIPLIGVNHLEGHLYSFLLHPFFQGKEDIKDMFPMISLLVSGGHTMLGVLFDIGSYTLLGETKDDAVGESFDKVARLLSLPYPGGPEIEAIASQGDINAYPFPSPLIHGDDFDFSYSGLKTAVLYQVRTLTDDSSQSFSPSSQRNLPKEVCADIAASFQYRAFLPLVTKTKKAVSMYKAKSVVVSGGVSANSFLKKLCEEECGSDDTSVFFPPFEYCQDNAAMIALSGYIEAEHNRGYPLQANGILGL